jgi:hypothetical protein
MTNEKNWPRWRDVRRSFRSLWDDHYRIGACHLCWAAVWKDHKDIHMKEVHGVTDWRVPR